MCCRQQASAARNRAASDQAAIQPLLFRRHSDLSLRARRVSAEFFDLRAAPRRYCTLIGNMVAIDSINKPSFAFGGSIVD